MDHAQLIVNRERLIESTKVLHEEVSKGIWDTALNVGSGSRILPGYRNIDFFAEGAVADDQVTLQTIQDGTVRLLYSSHALEHSGHRYTRKALKRWHQVMVPGGTLFISLPDLDLNMMSMLAASTKEARDWFRYTIFGYQAEQSNPEIECKGEYHLSGYNLQEFGEMLVEAGFEVQESYNYDGFGTWGMFFRAIKIP